MTSDATSTDAQDCPRCGKIPPLCVCTGVEPLDNRIELLILQHPQEQDKDLGTARLTALHFRNAQVRIGLSWPSLSKAAGREVDPKRWAILYLGSADIEAFPPGVVTVALDRKGKPLDDQSRSLAGLQGLVVLDGTWSQAKTLWWRNPWMLKCRRIALRPPRTSAYGKLRREPRREALSTLESAGMALANLEKRPELEKSLLRSFGRLLEAYRAMQRTAKATPPG